MVKRLILVHGLKRSGNHAVINWLMSQERFVFVNNAIPVAPILKGEAELPANPPQFEEWVRSNLLPRWMRNRLGQLIVLFNRSLIVSLEDHALNVVPFDTGSCRLTNLLIVRDPVNLFASRIRKASLMNSPAYPRAHGPLMQRVVDLWKLHARELLGYSSVLRGHQGIYFDQWFADQNYRRAVSEGLDLHFSDDGFSRVSDFGLGSSFDRTRYDADNTRMDVLNRKKYLSSDEQRLLQLVFGDPELERLGVELRQMAINNGGGAKEMPDASASNHVSAQFP